MTERRTFFVDRRLFDDPDFAPEPFTQREAWLWLISEASFKPGRRRGSTGVVDLQRGEFSHSIRFMAEAWRWSKSRVDRFLSVLENRDMLRDTSRDSHKIYYIKNYNRFQFAAADERDSIQDSERDTSGTAAGQTRRNEEREEKKIGASHGDAPGELELPINPEKPKAAAAKPTAEPDRFGEFWSAYPRREGANPRKPAADAFRRAVARGVDPAKIIAGAKRLAAKHAGERTPFVPQALTWLNQQRWDDDGASTSGVPPSPPVPLIPAVVTDEQWTRRLQWAREREQWRPEWGPPPGESGSLVPPHLVTTAQRQMFDQLRRAG